MRVFGLYIQSRLYTCSMELPASGSPRRMSGVAVVHVISGSLAGACPNTSAAYRSDEPRTTSINRVIDISVQSMR